MPRTPHKRSPDIAFCAWSRAAACRACEIVGVALFAEVPHITPNTYLTPRSHTPNAHSLMYTLALEKAHNHSFYHIFIIAFTKHARGHLCAHLLPIMVAPSVSTVVSSDFSSGEGPACACVCICGRVFTSANGIRVPELCMFIYSVCT
jgi:hypothetical protein